MAENFNKISKTLFFFFYGRIYTTEHFPNILNDTKTENEIKYKSDLRYKVENMINKGIIIKSFWRDVVKDPDISLLMMIVDDIGEKSGLRRKDLFDPNMKYIGISSVEINGSFVCYITLCTKE